jgi:hypothetical protein
MRRSPTLEVRSEMTMNLESPLVEKVGYQEASCVLGEIDLEV